VDSEETTAINLRRLVLRQLANSDIKEYLIEVNPSVAKYIESKEAETPVLPKLDGVKFYILSSESVHLADYKVVEITSQKEREKLLGKARVFC
jgi:hypothetical protein